MTLQHQQDSLLSSVWQWLSDRFLEIFIYSNILVAGGIASLVFFTQDTLSLPIDWQPVALIFAAALLPYTLDRILDSYVQEIPDKKVQSYFRHPGILLLLLVSVFATGILLYKAPLQVRLVSCGGLVPLIYGIPLLPLRRDKQFQWFRLKDIPGIKAWIVCGTLTYAVVAVPLAYAAAPFNLAAALLTMFLLVFIGSNSHIFDVRDVNSDREKGVLTMPVIIGLSGTRLIWTSLNLMILLLFWSVADVLPVPQLGVVVPATIVTLIYIWTLDTKTPRNVYNILIDGLLFLPALLTWVIA